MDTDFWTSLPLAAKLLILVEILESVLWMLLFVATLTQVHALLQLFRGMSNQT
jgi:hypothetical protein